MSNLGKFFSLNVTENFFAPFAKYQQTKISDGANIFGERERCIANYKSL
jgi:hypothetical protein